jgi:hypothetical protein
MNWPRTRSRWSSLRRPACQHRSPGVGSRWVCVQVRRDVGGVHDLFGIPFTSFAGRRRRRRVPAARRSWREIHPPTDMGPSRPRCSTNTCGNLTQIAGRLTAAGAHWYRTTESALRASWRAQNNAIERRRWTMLKPRPNGTSGARLARRQGSVEDGGVARVSCPAR